MKSIVKNVTPRELYDILCGIEKKKGKPYPIWNDFLFNLSTSFMRSPAMEMRYHWIDGDTDYVYVVKHSAIGQAVAKIDDPL